MRATKSKITANERAEQQQANRERNKLIAARGARFREEEKPLLDELREAGYAVSSVWHLSNGGRNKYPDAIPILLKHWIIS